jgi:hypothetical protein
LSASAPGSTIALASAGLRLSVSRSGVDPHGFAAWA